jgi:hypothetical protein
MLRTHATHGDRDQLFSAFLGRALGGGTRDEAAYDPLR